MNLSKVGYLIICLCLLATGYLLSGLLPTQKFTFSKEIDPLNGVSMMLSAILVVYVSILFDKVKEKSKLKKDVVLSQAGKLVSEIEKFSSILDVSSPSLDDIALGLKRLYKEYGATICLIKLADYSKGEFQKKFMMTYRDIRTLCTLTSNDREKSSTDIAVQNGKIIYSRSRLIAIGEKLSMLRDSTAKEQMRLIDF